MNKINDPLDFVAHLGQGSSALPATRRAAFEQFAREGGKLAAAAFLPLAATGCALVGKAVAPDTGLAKQVLEFAILLEELEHGFYVKALAAPGLIPTSDRAVFEQISKHEGAHVTFLKYRAHRYRRLAANCAGVRFHGARSASRRLPALSQLPLAGADFRRNGRRRIQGTGD